MRLHAYVLFACLAAVTSAMAGPRGYFGFNFNAIQPIGDFADTDPFNNGGGAAFGVGAGLEGGLSSRYFDFYLAWRVGTHEGEWTGEIPDYASVDASGTWTIQQWIIGGRMPVVRLSNATDITIGSGILLATAKGEASGEISNVRPHFFSPVYENDKSDLTGGFLVEAGLRTALSKNAQVRCNLQYQRFKPRFDTELWTGTLEMESWSLQIGISGFLNHE